jgi:hypothetical protein
MMYELEKSDSLVVPTKSANKTGLLVAESIEGSGGIARNAEMLKVWVTHYNGARPHIALGPGVPDPPRAALRVDEKSRIIWVHERWCAPARCWAACIRNIRSGPHWRDRVFAHHRASVSSNCCRTMTMALVWRATPVRARI